MLDFDKWDSRLSKPVLIHRSQYLRMNKKP
jgi:hypothetical protein